MENAGRSVAEVAGKMLGSRKKVLIVCGAGNNGGDGLVAARHLLNAGKKVSIFIVGKSSKLKADPKTNLKTLKKLRNVKFVRKLPRLRGYDLIIDAIFGIGLESNVRGPVSDVIELINRCRRPVLAVDVPSGLDADTGKVLGIAVKPKLTVTFVAKKNGLSAQNSGKMVVKDIGVLLDA